MAKKPYEFGGMGGPILVREDQLPTLERLKRALESAEADRLEIVLETSRGERLPLPEVAIELLQGGLHYLSQGLPVRMEPEEEVLTTTEAAVILNVSRQYLVRLLDDGKIPSHKAGTHRRVYREDVLAYKRTRDRDREKHLVRLMRLGESIQED